MPAIIVDYGQKKIIQVLMSINNSCYSLFHFQSSRPFAVKNRSAPRHRQGLGCD